MSTAAASRSRTGGCSTSEASSSWIWCCKDRPMRKTLGMNKHQKAAHRIKEQRIGHEQIAELLEQSSSDDPEERLLAAQYLCPCHVRRRIESVWEALYRLLEDEDLRVRRAAWHTLEDGGRSDDPTLDAILERVMKTDSDPQVQRFAH